MTTSHWFIGGGVEHSTEMVRRQTYASVGGSEGVAEATDLQVRPLAVPGGSVRVSLGSGFMKARHGGARNEMYMGSVIEEEIVAVPANTGGTIRRDLIVMRVHDPFYQGSPWQDPGAGLTPEEAAAARTAGKYIFVERIGSVPANTTRLQQVAGYENDTAITLARLDIPASTGTIQTEHIKDLRVIAQPKKQRELVTVYPTGVGNDARIMPTGGYASWPLIAAERPQVYVPQWASTIRIVCTMMGVRYSASSVQSAAGLRTGFGTTTPGQNTVIIEDPQSSAGRHLYAVVGTHKIPESMRGTWQSIDVQAVRSQGTGTWSADTQTSVLVDFEFSEDLGN